MLRVRNLIASVLAAALLAPASTALAQGARAQTADQAEAALLNDLLLANHILADQEVLDAFGHISVRSIKNPKHFYLARARAPGLVEPADIIEFDENAEAIDARGRAPYQERFIHSEIYRARPDVGSVIHSHSPATLPYGLTKQPLLPVTHLSAFLGATPTPVFDIRDTEGEKNYMLVRTAPTGAALARTLGKRAVVLMRGHGMTVVAPDVRAAVFRAVYTQMNAQVQSEALRFGKPNALNAYEADRLDAPERPWEMWVDRVTKKP